MSEIIEKRPVFIKQITITNFKSFFGHRDIALNKTFTLLGGITDDFLSSFSFVLGESLANLGVRSVLELICDREELSNAEVSITVVQEDETESIFQRSIEAQRSSEIYLVDGVEISKSGYLNKLKNLGFTLKKSINSLDSVAKMSLLSNKELTEMIENMSGSISKREEYYKNKFEMENTELEVTHSHHQLNDWNQRLKDTKKDEENAINYKTLQRKIDQLVKKISLVLLYGMENDVKLLEAQKEELNQQLAEIDQEDLRSQRLDVLKSYYKLTVEKFDDSQKFFNLHGSSENKKIEFKNVVKVTEALKRSEESYIAKMTQLIKSNDEKIERSNSRKQEKLEEKEKIQSLIEDFPRFKQIFDDPSSSIHDEYLALQNQIKATTLLKPDYSNLAALNKKLIQKYQNDIKTNKSKISSLKEKFEQLKKESSLDELELELRKLQLEKDRTLKHLKTHKSHISSAVSEQHKKSVEEILRENFTGIVGRVSEYCRVMEATKLETVQKVFGVHWNAIIVDSWSTAIKCIEYLEFLRLEPEYFIPLNFLPAEKLTVPKNRENCPLENLLNIIEEIEQGEIEKAVICASKKIYITDTFLHARNIVVDSKNQVSVISEKGLLFNKNHAIENRVVSLDLKESEDLCELKLKNLKVEKQLEDVDLKIISKQMEIDDLKRKSHHTESELKTILEMIDFLKQDVNQKQQFIDLLQPLNQEDDTFNLQEYENTHFEGFCNKYGIPDVEFYRDFHSFEAKSAGKLEILDAEIEQTETNLETLEQAKVDFEAKLTESSTKFDASHLTLQHRQLQTEIQRLEGEIAALKPKMENSARRFSELQNKAQELTDNSEKLKKIEQDLMICANNLAEKKRAKYLRLLEFIKTLVKVPLVEGELIDLIGQVEENDDESLIETKLNSIHIDFSSISQHFADLENPDRLKMIESNLRTDIKRLRDTINKLKTPQSDYKTILNYIKNQIAETKTFHEAAKGKLTATRELFERIKNERTTMFKGCLEQVVQFIKDWFKTCDDDIREIKYELLNEDEPYLDGIVFSATRTGNVFVPISEMYDDVKNLFGMALMTMRHVYQESPFFLLDFSSAKVHEHTYADLLDNLRDQEVCQVIVFTKDLAYFKYAPQYYLMFCSEKENGKKTYEVDQEDIAIGELEGI